MTLDPRRARLWSAMGLGPVWSQREPAASPGTLPEVRAEPAAVTRSERIGRMGWDERERAVAACTACENINGHSLLLECGFFQGRRQESYARNLNFPFTPGNVDAVILSHAHIDHSGNLPNLVKQGCSGPIYATSATAHLAYIMLMDSGHIQEEDAGFISKRNLKRGEPPAVPLYTQEQAAVVKQYFLPVDYDQPFEPVPGVEARLVDAGHILGSASVVLDINEKGRKLRMWFSGDIGRRKLPLIRDPGNTDHFGNDHFYSHLLELCLLPK